jgi:hypothetical protein
MPPIPRFGSVIKNDRLKALPCLEPITTQTDTIFPFDEKNGYVDKDPQQNDLPPSYYMVPSMAVWEYDGLNITDKQLRRTIIDYLTTMLVVTPGSYIFVKDITDRLFNETNVKERGLVRTILTTYFNIDIKQINVCRLCKKKSGKITCGVHYKKSVLLGRTKRNAIKNVAFQ